MEHGVIRHGPYVETENSTTGISPVMRAVQHA
jgi:hypothetical protein